MKDFEKAVAAEKAKRFDIKVEADKIYAAVSAQAEDVQDATLCMVVNKYKVGAEAKITAETQEIDKLIATSSADLNRVEHELNKAKLKINRAYLAEYQDLELKILELKLDEQGEIEVESAKYDATMVAIRSKIETLKERKTKLTAQVTAGKVGLSCCHSDCHC
jgi:hypothetical protein